MSDVFLDRLNIDELVARIERQQAETRKFANESFKLAAEARKLGRDRWLAPVIAVSSSIAAVGAMLAAYGSLIRSAGS